MYEYVISSNSDSQGEAAEIADAVLKHKSVTVQDEFQGFTITLREVVEEVCSDVDFLYPAVEKIAAGEDMREAFKSKLHAKAADMAYIHLIDLGWFM